MEAALNLKTWFRRI